MDSEMGQLDCGIQLDSTPSVHVMWMMVGDDGRIWELSFLAWEMLGPLHISGFMQLNSLCALYQGMLASHLVSSHLVEIGSKTRTKPGCVYLKILDVH